MIHPKNIEYKIGFDQVRELLKVKCDSDLGRANVDKIQFISKQALIEKLLLQTEDFRKILTSRETFPSSNYVDLDSYLNNIQYEGSYLEEEEMFQLALTLETILLCLDFFSKNASKYPHLQLLASAVTIESALPKLISGKFEFNGKLKDSASKELSDIRISIGKKEKDLRKLIDSIFRKSRENGYSPKDGQVTLREGRLVIPVHVESKRKIKGVVQDESATGQTAFIEPAEVIEVNNELRELVYQERRAIIKILTELSDRIRPSIPALLKANQFLGIIDFIRAKARLAIDIDAALPELVSSNDQHQLVTARHPLLYLLNKKLGKDVVPLDITFKRDERIIVISGPNAGGKSVSLKTVGLLQYMVQCGLLIPASESSQVSIFNKLFVDIGDEQSIENDLSTYSSHLQNLKTLLDNADTKTLFLIDEFGSGTEPQFGGSIAEVILLQLLHQRAYGIVTTHYSNLKKLAEKTKGIVNAAMRFDVDNLSPLYQLDIGKPGSSFALEIAASIGLNKKLIDRAKSLVGHSHVKFEKLVGELESEKTKYQELIASNSKKQKWLDGESKDYQDLKQHLENERLSIIKSAKDEARHIIAEANRKIEQTIKDIKESRANKERTRQSRENLAQHQKRLSTQKNKKARVLVKKVNEVPSVGDKVRIKGQESVGDLIKVKGKKAEVMLGSIKSLVNLENLEKVAVSENKSYNKSDKARRIAYERKAADFKANLDLRGQRAAEVTSKLDAFIDEALLLGIDELRIIHGKGDGILREVVRNYLKTYDQIESITDEHVELGGAGVSVVKLA